MLHIIKAENCKNTEKKELIVQFNVDDTMALLLFLV
jgi:hypothetical protein